MKWSVLLLLACSSTPEPQRAPEASGPPAVASAEPQGPPVGEKHPPIPADNPAWKDNTPGFRANHFFYGERSWADVRMRVAGQIAVIERDRARLAAMSGKPAEAAQRYQDLAERLGALNLSGSAVADGVRDRLVRAAQRDAALLRGVAAGGIPEELRSLDGGLAGLRATVLHWSLSNDHRPTSDAVAAWAAAMSAAPTNRPDLQIDAFSDFDDRHQLRLRLLDAYLDTVDPIGFSDPWGYWKEREIPRQSLALMRTAEMFSPFGSEGLTQGLVLPELEGPPRWQRASLIARHNPAKGRVIGFTAEGLGQLPTGDSLIDVAGEPGPKAIGKLERLGLDDPDHKVWLGQQAAFLNQSLVTNPSSLPARLIAMTDQLDAHGHGSRYYNIKAARNAAVVQLARKGEFLVARDVLALNRPLHHQDWACPNRAGILLAIEGRLLANAGDPSAEKVLSKARRISEDFLTEVDLAEAAGH